MSWLDSRAFGPIYAENDVAYVSTTTGYFTKRLTGQCIDTVANNTEAQWPIDPFSWDWSDDPQKFIQFRISRNRLFALQLPGTILGTITKEAARETGLLEGIPVVATANDKAVEALGSGLLDSGKGLVSLGTYIASMVSGTEYMEGCSAFYTNLSCVPKRYLYESDGIWRGMWTVSWLADTLGDEIKQKAAALGIAPEEFMNREAAMVPAGSDGLLTVPEWLMPSYEPHKRGMMIGFDVRHTRAHMYRSLLEGIAMTMKSKFDEMCSITGAHPKELILSGGGSNSTLFCQIFADVFGMRVIRNEINGAAGLGAAICAAVATGVWKSFDQAVEKMVKVRDTFEPDAQNHQLYTKINTEVFSKLSSVNDELLQKLYTIIPK
jgi:sugar (pentulose or hexulose) kinase